MSKIITNIRPQNFYIDYEHPLAQGLVFFGGGAHAGSLRYHDSSLYENTGTLTNMDPATNWLWIQELGRYGTNHVAASNQYIFSNSSAVRSAYPCTMAAWMYRRSTGACAISVCNTSVTNHYLALGIYNTATAVYAASGGTQNRASAGIIAENTWGHIAGTCESETSRTAWCNGVPGIPSTTSRLPLNLNSTAIGVVPASTPILLSNDIIADAFIWNRILSPDEIKILADPSNVMLSGLIEPVTPQTYWFVNQSITNPNLYIWLRSNVYNTTILGLKLNQS